MFGSGIYNIGGNIPDVDYKKIEKFTSAFFNMLKKLTMEGKYDIRIARLMKPTNAAVLLDDQQIHFIFTNKGIGGVTRIVHNDFRGKGTITLSTALSIVERESPYRRQSRRYDM